MASPATRAHDGIAIYGLLDACLVSVKGSAAGINALGAPSVHCARKSTIFGTTWSVASSINQ